MKYLKILLLLILAFIVSCGGPSGATREERSEAEHHAQIADAIMKNSTLNNKNLLKAYNEYEQSVHGYRDDERELAKIILKQGIILHLLGRHSKAVNKFKKSIKYSPRQRKPYLYLVKSYMKLKRPKLVIIWSNKAIDKISNFFEMYFYAGETYYKLRKFLKSENSFQKAIDNGADGKFLTASRHRIAQIRRILRNNAENVSINTSKFLHKNILTFNDVSKILNSILSIKKAARLKNTELSLSSDTYNLLKQIKIYDKVRFLREKFVSRGDFAYILVKTIEYLKSKSLDVLSNYQNNPGIPDIKSSYYAFSHILYIIEQNIMQLNDEGNFGVLKNLTGVVCIKAINTIKQRFFR